MEAKEYLKQIQQLDTILKQKKQELSDLRILSRSLTGIDYSKERVQSRPSCNAPFEDAVCKMADLEAEINDEIVAYAMKKHEIINMIHKLKSRKHIDILHKKYVELKQLEVIAVEMGYTYPYVVELHGKAINEFQKNL